MYIQKRYDKSVRPQPQDFKAKQYQTILANFPKDLFDLLQHPEQRRKYC